MIQIRAPIWNGGKRCVGIAEYRIIKQDPYTQFEITYTDKHGERTYPHPFRVSTRKLMAGRKQMVDSGVVLRIVPLADCEVSW